MSEIPSDLKFTSDHEWVRSEDGGSVTIGITDYAQDALGDVVFVQLPEVGATLSAGESCGEVESTKSVSDLIAPLSGTVTAVNEALDGTPELVNSAPYGDGWLYSLTPSDASQEADLLDAAGYEAILD